MFPDVFSGKLGKYVKGTCSFQVQSGAKPVFCKARPVPYAIKEKIEKELDRLEKEGIVEFVSKSDWATPIVPVFKQNGDIRLCGDYKITINPVLIKTNRHPIPRINDLLVKMSGAVIFSKIDLAHAYQQIPLDDKSKELLTLITQKGLVRPCRFFGIKLAPEEFQGMMERELVDIENVVVYYDDICVFGKDKKVMTKLY